MIAKVGLLGASGRMGLEVAALLRDGFNSRDVLLELADVVTGSPRLRSIEGVETRLLSDPPREPVHVWIDFSHPTATMELLENIDTPILIATTGFTAEQLTAIEAYASRHPVLLTSNTSPGMNLVMKILRELPGGLSFDLALTEEHHRNKKDAPSGTAKSLVEILKTRGYEDVPVTSVRAGGIRGVHTLKIVGNDEMIEIRHEALDRKVFAEGALIGAAFLARQKKPGFYHMADALENKP